MRGHTFIERRFRLTARDANGACRCKAYDSFEKIWSKAQEYLSQHGRLVALFDRVKNKTVYFDLERSKKKCIKELERNGYLV